MRQLLPIALAVAVLGAPASALAAGAGDNQYGDPYGTSTTRVVHHKKKHHKKHHKKKHHTYHKTYRR